MQNSLKDVIHAAKWESVKAVENFESSLCYKMLRTGLQFDLNFINFLAL